MQNAWHRIDKSTVDLDAKTAMCSVCGQVRVRWRKATSTWFCAVAALEYRKKWGKAHPDKEAAGHRRWNQKNQVKVIEAWIRFWQRKLAEATSAEVAREVVSE